MRTVALLFLIGCASPRPCPAVSVVARPQMFVWDVRGAGAPIILFGTHHAAARADIPADVLRDLDRAELFVAAASEGGKDDTTDSGTGWGREASLRA